MAIYLRKVQKINQSFWVSLPLAWAREISLNKGDTVEVEVSLSKKHITISKKELQK